MALKRAASGSWHDWFDVLERGFMTKQMKAAMAAMVMVGTLPMMAQTSQTDIVKVAPGQTKKTVIHRKNGATDTVISEGTSGTAHHTVKHKPVAHKEPVESATERKLRELEAKQAALQAQIDSLTAANAAKDAALAQAQQTAQAAQSQAQAATAQSQSVTATVQQNTTDVQTLKSSLTDLQSTNVGLAQTISANKVELAEKIESPSTIHYKGVTIQPVAFFAAEGVWRQRSVNSDINTPFNSIPFPSANEGHVSELNFSGRQSRIGGLFEGKAKGYKLAGYFESDFLGTGTSSNNNQSNSYVLRQRQIWGQAATDAGFTITGGQMWSLVTEDGKGADARTEKLPNTIDPQYMVGFSWTRQPEIRVQQRFGDYKTGAVTLAASIEQAQITNFTSNGTNPAEYFFAGPGQNGGLYNAAAGAGAGNTASTSAITTYANNVAPDVIVKAAFDNKYGHAEIGGIGRFLRDYYFPVLTYNGTASAPTYTYASTYTSNTKTAGGVFGSVRGTVNKYLDVAVQGMVGQGTGRYGSSQLADATLRPDETLEPIRNYHGLFSLETHPTPKFDAFAYYGGEYAQRTVYQTPEGNLIGYGPTNVSDAGCYNLPPASVSTAGSGGSLGAVSCGSPTKYIQEGMIGFTYRVVSSPTFGRLQYSATYQLIQRQLWSGVGSATTPASPRAQDGMIHVGMRYYIP
jgi:hypothetical protein